MGAMVSDPPTQRIVKFSHAILDRFIKPFNRTFHFAKFLG